MQKLVINQEFQNLIPPLTRQEYDDLEASMLEHGCKHAIDVWNGVIVDGHNRYEICQKHSIEFSTFEMEFDSDADARIWIYKNQSARRNLTPAQRDMLALALKKELEAKGKANQRLSQGRGKKGFENSQNLIEPIDSTRQAAEQFGTSENSMYKTKKVMEEGDEETKAQLLAGEISRNEAAKRVKKKQREKRRAEREPVPAVVEPSGKQPTIFRASAENVPQISDSSIDVIITSPPYNLGHSKYPMGGDGRTAREKGIGYNDDMNEADYQDWQVEVFLELYRVAKPGASLFYNHKPRNNHGVLFHPMDWIRRFDNPWVLRQEIIWDRKSTHNHNPTLFWPEDERVYWMTKGEPTLPDRPIGMSTVWRYFGPVPNTWHPAPFTEELPRMCLKAIGRDGITVLDPFMGSGTTLRVALEFGYDAIGVDISEEYIQRAMGQNGWTSESNN